MKTRTFQVTLLMVFGAIAVALSGIGVFGVMSYAVAQGAKEFGIRLALGATPRSLQRMVVNSVVRLLSTGVALGVPLAVAAAYFMRDLLFGVPPQDVRVLLGSSETEFVGKMGSMGRHLVAGQLLIDRSRPDEAADRYLAGSMIA